MGKIPEVIADFLNGRRIAVAGVSRSGDSAANAVFKKLRSSGYDTFAINPNASQVEGVTCYSNLGSVPGELDGIVVATHPAASVTVVRQAAECGVRRVWFHRAFGQGSVSPEAVEEGARCGLTCIVGGCPLMYCEPVDLGHRCMRGWLRWRGHLPK